MPQAPMFAEGNHLILVFLKVGMVPDAAATMGYSEKTRFGKGRAIGKGSGSGTGTGSFYALACDGFEPTSTP